MAIVPAALFTQKEIDTMQVEALFRRHFTPLKGDQGQSLDELSQQGRVEGRRARTLMPPYGTINKWYSSNAARALASHKLVAGEVVPMPHALLSIGEVALDPGIGPVYREVIKSADEQGRKANVAELFEALPNGSAMFIHSATRHALRLIACEMVRENPGTDFLRAHIVGHSPLIDLGIDTDDMHKMPLLEPGDMVRFQVVVDLSGTVARATILPGQTHIPLPKITEADVR